MDKVKREEAPIYIYRPSGFLQFGMPLAIIIYAIFQFGLVVQLGEMPWIFFTLFLLLHGLMVWIGFVYIAQHHLALYKDGLEYRYGSKRIFSRWEDMQGFEWRTWGKASAFGIVSRKIEKRQEASFIEKPFIPDYGFFIPINLVDLPILRDGCWTGLVVDMNKLAETNFGRNLQEYAPQLFEYGKEKQKNG